MKDYGNPKMQKQYGVIYDFYGIYIDWQIDHNIFPQLGIHDPHGIKQFKDFYTPRHWQVAKTRVQGHEMLIIDVNLAHFSYVGMTNIQKHVLEDNIPGSEIMSRLKEWQRSTCLPAMNQIQYYLHLVRIQGNSGQVEIVDLEKKGNNLN